MNEETPSPTVGGSIDPLDDEAAAPLAIIDHHRSSVRSGDARSASGGSGGGTTRRAFRTPLARSPRPPVRAAAAPPPRAKVSDGGGAPPLLTRPERLLRQEMCRLKRQNSDPSPALKRRPKFEIMPPPSPNASSLFERPISPVYRHQIDEDLLQVPLRSGTSPSVVSFQSDPESCLDGLYTMKYGEDDDDYEEPFSIGRPKFEIMPPPSPNASSLFERPISPVYRHQIDEDLLQVQVPLRSGTSPSVVSFQSDPESCLDGLYTMKYGEDDDDYEEPFSIGWWTKMF
uniref:Uncharacterized protein n=1 Tax=Globodera pallida TaxID=36090 RepID=A0A183BIZ6_GLOPA